MVAESNLWERLWLFSTGSRNAPQTGDFRAPPTLREHYYGFAVLLACWGETCGAVVHALG